MTRALLKSPAWLLSLTLVCGPAGAQFTRNDLQIAGRALGFLEKPMSGEVRAGIVYSPADPQSIRAADDLKQLLGNGLRVGNVTLKPVLVPIDDAGHADVALFLLTDGVTGAPATAFADAARVRRMPCITTDLDQVKSGVCAMGISSQPAVEILVNRASAAGSRLTFSTIFRLMITET